MVAVIDDDAAFRQSLVRLLKSGGFCHLNQYVLHSPVQAASDSRIDFVDVEILTRFDAELPQHPEPRAIRCVWRVIFHQDCKPIEERARIHIGDLVGRRELSQYCCRSARLWAVNKACPTR